MTFNEKMTAIANEVRTLSGASGSLNLDKLASNTKDANNEVIVQQSLIRQIQNALEGKGSVGGSTPANPIVEPLFVTANGKYTPPEGVDGYSPVEVDVPIPPEPVIKPLSIIENGTYTVPAGVAGYSPIEVAVPVPDGYIKPSGTLEITENGSFDVTQLERVEVNVESSGVDIDGIIDGSIKEITSNAVLPVEGALEYRGDLETANFPSAIEVSYSMFGSCTSLKNVSFPKAEAIYSDAFYDCSSLEAVNFPSVTTIDSYAFEQCVNLSKVDLGQAQSIHGAAFYDCSNLTVLILRGENVCILGSGLQGTSLRSRGHAYVLKKLVDTYKKTTNWAAIADRIHAIEDYPEICGG